MLVIFFTRFFKVIKIINFFYFIRVILGVSMMFYSFNIYFIIFNFSGDWYNLIFIFILILVWIIFFIYNK